MIVMICIDVDSLYIAVKMWYSEHSNKMWLMRIWTLFTITLKINVFLCSERTLSISSPVSNYHWNHAEKLAWIVSKFHFRGNTFREAGRFFANFRFPFLKDLPGKFSAGEKLAAFCNAKEQSELCNKAQVIGSRKLCSRRPPFFCLLFHPRKCEKLLRS